MLRLRIETFLLLAAAVFLETFAVHELFGFGSDAVDAAFASWFQPTAFLGCGLATLLRAAMRSDERAPWTLMGSGLVLYAIGSVYFNLGFGDDPSPPFPSL